MCISDYWLNDIGSEKSQNLPYFWNTKTHIGRYIKKKRKKNKYFLSFFLNKLLGVFYYSKNMAHLKHLCEVIPS